MKTIQSLRIAFYLNGRFIEIDITPETRAIDLIREMLGLTGTKEVCSEGDCGACTIALGRWELDQFVYRAVASCILPAARLHGTHVITVEGLACDDKLHLIQQMMLDHHAIQCGYCSPGIVMSLFCLFSEQPNPSREEVLAALEGNLCRCTGYKAIDDATKGMVANLQERADQWQTVIFPGYAKEIPKKLKSVNDISHVSKTVYDVEVVEKYLIPVTLEELFDGIEKHKGHVQLIAGGTDLMVETNVDGFSSSVLIDLSQLDELNFISEDEGRILIGASVTHTALLESVLIQEKLSSLCDVLQLMASKQIRNVAGLAGNIASAAPVADGTCALLGLGADVVLKSKDNERKIPLSEFYKDYRKTVLKENEIISGIEVPIQKGHCSFEKGSKRLAVDISKVCSFVNIELEDNKIVNCRIAFGGAEKYPALAKESAKKVIGKVLSPEVVNELPELVLNEFKGYMSKRTEPEYRFTMVKNQMISHLNKCTNL